MYLVDLALGRGTVLVLALAIASGLAAAGTSEEVLEHERIVVTDTETTILDVVEFEPGTAALHPRSRPILDAVAATLQGNPSIELVEVQSHTRGDGDEAADLALTQERAEAVVAYLVDVGGVDETRLTAQGYGDTQPIDLDHLMVAKNERVSFLILRRASDNELFVGE